MSRAESIHYGYTMDEREVGRLVHFFPKADKQRFAHRAGRPVKSLKFSARYAGSKERACSNSVLATLFRSWECLYRGRCLTFRSDSGLARRVFTLVLIGK